MIIPYAVASFNRGAGGGAPNPLLADYDFAFATVVGGNVIALADRSGTGDAAKDLVVTGTLPLTAADAAYNNKPLATFNGSQRLEGGAWATACAQPYTVYVVGESQASNGRIVDGASGARGIVMNNGGLWSIYAGSVFVDVPASTPGSPTILIAVFDGAGSSVYITDPTTADATGNPGADTVTQFTLGALTGGGGELTGKIARVMIYGGVDGAAARASKLAALVASYA
jgi:hypothetical protein